MAHGLAGIGIVEFISGNFEAARAFFEEAIPLQLEVDEFVDAAAGEMMVAQCARRLGDLNEARRRFLVAISALEQNDQLLLMTELVQEVGALLTVERRLAEAATLFGWVERRLEEITGVRWDSTDYEGHIDTLRMNLPTEALIESWEGGSSMALDEVVAYARSALQPVGTAPTDVSG